MRTHLLRTAPVSIGYVPVSQVAAHISFPTAGQVIGRHKRYYRVHTPDFPHRYPHNIILFVVATLFNTHPPISAL